MNINLNLLFALGLLYLSFEAKAQFIGKVTYEETKPGFDLRKFGFENSDQVPLSAAQIAGVNRRVRSEKIIYTLYFDQTSSFFQFEEDYRPWLEDSDHKGIKQFYEAENFKKLHPIYYKSYAPRLLWVKGGTLLDDHMVEDNLDLLNDWQLQTGDSIISGLKCKKAITSNNKNQITTVWYTPDIPVPDGPFYWSGLPGLIVAVRKHDETVIVLKKIHEITQNDLPKLNPEIMKIKISYKEWQEEFPPTPGFR